MPTPEEILTNEQVDELLGRDVCDHRCAMLTPSERDALCATVKALREQVERLTSQWCECGHAKTAHGFFSDHDECCECDQSSDDLCCGWRPVPRPAEPDLQSQLSQLQGENERLKRGDFTDDEFQNFCHNLSEQDRDSFFDGCTKYQKQLFGTSAVAELKKELGNE